jgi:DNA-directed RNA polymerase beta' subunit
MHDKDKVFIHSIPVFTTLLRPTDIVSNTLYYEKINGYYNMIVKLASSVNKNKRKIDRTVRIKNLQLFKLQQKFMVLYDEIIEILNGKKGELRNLVSGRFNFTSRSVIRQNPELRIDQVELPYVELVITQQQRIINILHRMLNISYQEAYDKWFVAIGKVDQTIVNILWDLIKATPEGLPVLINRNPTMEYDVALARNGQRKTN